MTQGFRRTLLGLALLCTGATGAYAAPPETSVNIFFWYEYAAAPRDPASLRLVTRAWTKFMSGGL